MMDDKAIKALIEAEIKRQIAQKPVVVPKVPSFSDFLKREKKETVKR